MLEKQPPKITIFSFEVKNSKLKHETERPILNENVQFCYFRIENIILCTLRHEIEIFMNVPERKINVDWWNLSVHWRISIVNIEWKCQNLDERGIISRNRFSKTSNSWNFSCQNFTRWEIWQECTLKLQIKKFSRWRKFLKIFWRFYSWGFLILSRVLRVPQAKLRMLYPNLFLRKFSDPLNFRILHVNTVFLRVM